MVSPSGTMGHGDRLCGLRIKFAGERRRGRGSNGQCRGCRGGIGPHVKRVVIANPKQVRIIAHAKIKTDTIDAGVLAQLYASGFLPEVWIADEPMSGIFRSPE